jgi:beta-aspartyl-peptidase (threonine type)
MKEHYAIAIHGGAGTIEKSRITADLYKQYENALEQALVAGLEILQHGGTSLDAVEAAVMALEDCPFFNAGRGSVFNNKGRHEMDAAIMDGSSLAAGAVAGLQLVKNPVKVARMVMDKTNYVLLCGEGANEFAKAHQIPTETEAYFYTEYRYNDWKRKQQRSHSLDSGKHLGTVGAVALDKTGNLAAATSTGGLTNKNCGRVGDSPIIGAGTYANNKTCAVSCTGDGEQFIRAVAAYDLSCCMEYKKVSLPQACVHTMQKLEAIQGSGGLIAIDASGHIVMPFNTEGMYRACYHPDGVREIKIFD